MLMRRYKRHTTVSVPLFIALLAAPAIVQEGLLSLWAPWGLPLLAAAGVFTVLAGLIGLARALSSGKTSPRTRKAGEDREPTASEERASTDDSREEEEVEPDLVLSEALNELEPGNLMDLVRALQEMGRHGDALEVLARVSELKEGDYTEEVARALRRMRRQLQQEASPRT